MVYVMGDIHGNTRRFNSILQQIQLQPEDTLYVLGDVIDRHGDGVRILRQLMAMPNAKVLLGNHEYMMLQALQHPTLRAEIEPSPSAVKAWSPNHWTAREFPETSFFYSTLHFKICVGICKPSFSSSTLFSAQYSIV